MSSKKTAPKNVVPEAPPPPMPKKKASTQVSAKKKKKEKEPNKTSKDINKEAEARLETTKTAYKLDQVKKATEKKGKVSEEQVKAVKKMDDGVTKKTMKTPPMPKKKGSTQVSAKKKKEKEPNKTSKDLNKEAEARLETTKTAYKLDQVKKAIEKKGKVSEEQVKAVKKMDDGVTKKTMETTKKDLKQEKKMRENETVHNEANEKKLKKAREDFLSPENDAKKIRDAMTPFTALIKDLVDNQIFMGFKAANKKLFKAIKKEGDGSKHKLSYTYFMENTAESKVHHNQFIEYSESTGQIGFVRLYVKLVPLEKLYAAGKFEAYSKMFEIVYSGMSREQLAKFPEKDAKTMKKLSKKYAIKKQAKKMMCTVDQVNYFVLYYESKANIKALASAAIVTKEPKGKELQNMVRTFMGEEMKTKEWVEIYEEETTFPKTPETTKAKLKSRLEQLGGLGTVTNIIVVDVFDQIIEAFGDGSLHKRILNLPHLFQVGGVCGDVSEHWIDYMANPKRTANSQISFRSAFSPFLALSDASGPSLTNYDGKSFHHHNQRLSMVEERLKPVFTRFSDKNTQAYSLQDLSPALWKNEKGPAKELLDKFLPNDDTTTGRYMYIVIQHGGSGHVLAIAKPVANVDEYHMFDPNVGQFSGTQDVCNAWLRKQYNSTYTSADGWSVTNARSFEYKAAEAVTADGNSKHYVAYLG
jgi:hypothetical protein